MGNGIDWVLVDTIVKRLTPTYVYDDGRTEIIIPYNPYEKKTRSASNGSAVPIDKAYKGEAKNDNHAVPIKFGLGVQNFLEDRIREIARQMKEDNTGSITQPTVPGSCYYFTVPADTTRIEVELQAGGSAGVGGHYGTSKAHIGASGGGGGYFKGVISVTPGESIYICCGAGGVFQGMGGAYYIGTAGGNSSFRDCVVYGGGQTTAPEGQTPTPGAGGGGLRNYEGNWIDGQAGNNGNPGNGGNSALGTGGTGYNWDCNGCVGQAGVGYGSGGGAGGDSVAGGVGAPGYVALRYGRDV